MFPYYAAGGGWRIQLGWGRIPQPGMPFNNLMLLPPELTLRTTKSGVRLFSVPVKEIEALFTKVQQAQNLTPAQASQQLQAFNASDRLRLKTTI
ncbi:hypothetical protein [Adhaeribacter rhizoryzae]|uniref:Uncharacterized protein n=1 Tax=Adhaeribacter rhizoryzae TaxID=2607907 RepID=A0A5M6DMP7_9BACT|nr:hypothetical protein [Adhaeribacter rhizoryzae]KAA5548817.1 hypothetical protein F0145_04700 [Adhaeribacter rhizoryzae]